MADLADLYGGPEGAYEVAIFRQLEDGLSHNPDEPAVIIAYQDADHLSELVDGISAPASSETCLVWTYSQLKGAATRLARALMAEGVDTKASMAILLPPGVEFCVLLWATAILKMPLAPLDPEMLQAARRDELRSVLSSLAPAVVVMADSEHEAHVRDQVAPAGLQRFLMVVADGSGSQDSTGLVQLVAHGAQHQLDTEALLENGRTFEPDLMAYYCFTSGTSVGRPKGCLHSVRLAAHAVRNYMSFDRIGRPSRQPFYHAVFRVSGIYGSLRVWSQGGTLVMACPTYDQDKVLDAMERYRCTGFGGTPNTLQGLVNDPTFATRKLDSVDLVTLGADAITPAAIALAQKAFPHAWITVLYGMTEGACLLSWPYPNTPVSEIPLFGEICPMGKIKPTVRLRIRDVDSGDIAKRNQAGEIMIAGDRVIRHYLGGAHAEAFVDDDVARWYCTGDLGMVNDDGLVYVLGRLKDIIKRRGATLVPSAMESCLQKFTGSLVAVVAVPSAEYGHEPYAVLESFGGKTEVEIKDEVIRMCDSRHVLAGSIELSRIGMEEFPLNATAKIVKTEVQAALLAYLDGQKTAT